MDIITYNGTEYIASEERYGFTNAVKSAISCGYNEDICHYVSFDYMKKTLVARANQFRQGLLSKVDLNNKLELLAKAILANADSDDVAISRDIQSYINEITKVPNNECNLSSYLNKLLYRLNNEPANLRAGLSGWNRSISSQYDPFGWVHYNAEGYIDSTNLNISDEYKEVPSEERNCFHIVNNVDCNKLSCLLKLDEGKLPEMYSAVYNGYAILYSSNNYSIPFDSNPDNFSPCEEEIYVDIES